MTHATRVSYTGVMVKQAPGTTRVTRIVVYGTDGERLTDVHNDEGIVADWDQESGWVSVIDARNVKLTYTGFPFVVTETPAGQLDTAD